MRASRCLVICGIFFANGLLGLILFPSNYIEGNGYLSPRQNTKDDDSRRTQEPLTSVSPEPEANTAVQLNWRETLRISDPRVYAYLEKFEARCLESAEIKPSWWQSTFGHTTNKNVTKYCPCVPASLGKTRLDIIDSTKMHKTSFRSRRIGN